MRVEIEKKWKVIKELRDEKVVEIKHDMSISLINLISYSKSSISR
jgi:hypothetical protein